jgi:hypothetical protein
VDPALAALIRAHRADIAELTGLARGDLDVLWRRLSSDPERARDALVEILAQLGETYGAAAATLGADWYEELREALGVAGRFSAVASELPDEGRYEALAGWAVGPMFSSDPDIAAALALASGGLQKVIADADRLSVTQSSIADPKAEGWQRAGAGDCPFCDMLIGRGAVYTKESVRFGSHDSCKCVGVPAFGGRPVAVKPYEPTRSNITDADRARVKAWIAENL